MSELRRLNHWVPASYLEPFTSDGSPDGLVAAYRRDSRDRVIEVPPRALGKERDLYVVERGPGLLDDSLERMLADHIEGPFVPVRNQLAFGHRVGFTGLLLPDQKRALAHFMAFQQTRTPLFRENLNMVLGFQGNVMTRALFQNVERARRDLEEVHGRPFTRAEVEAMRDSFESGRIRLEPSDKAWLEHAMKLALDISPILKELPHRVLHAPPGISVPTSDNPVTMVTRGSEAEFTMGGGWAAPNCEVTFPLSPTAVLVMGDGLRAFDDHGSPEWWDQVRERMARGAAQWLISRGGDPQAADILWGTEPPRMVLEYVGGKVRPGDDLHAAARHMMDTHDGEAILILKPEQ